MNTGFDNTKPDSRIPVFLAAAVVLLAIQGCGGKDAPEAPAVVRPVKMVELSTGGLAMQVEYPGRILPNRQADMAFEVPGLMTGIYVEEGQYVETGQLLAKLDARDYEAARNAAAAQLEVARVEADRARALYDRQATSKQRLDLAVSNLKVAEAAHERALKAYNDTFLKAPINGVVSKILVEDVVNVQAKQGILIIQNLDKLKATADIPETVGAFAQPGLTLEERTAFTQPVVYLSFLPERGFPAVLVESSVMADPATRTYEVTVMFDPPQDLVILPGMTAKVVLHVGSRLGPQTDAFAVPANSVASDEEGGAFVWVVDSETMQVRRQPVTIGEVSGDRMEISSDGLSEGDRVVTSGVQNLLQGDTVRPFNP
jgi:RND family efflux transporter MFP subunit